MALLLGLTGYAAFQHSASVAEGGLLRLPITVGFLIAYGIALCGVAITDLATQK